MGIRFSCENGHAIHVKSFLAGKRGICPKCGVKVQIPLEGTSAESGASFPVVVERETDTSRLAHDSVPPRRGPPTRWYVRAADGQQYGPATSAVFQEWVGAGRVGADCLVWREDWDGWRPAAEVLAEEIPSPKRALHVAEVPQIDLPQGEDPLRGRVKRKSRKLVIALIATCLALLFPLLYVVTVMS